MSIHIQARGFALTRALETFAQKRITQVFGKRLDSVGALKVRLSDINGPKGGADKCCRVHIALPKQPDLVIEDVQPNMYDAINSAVRRAQRALGRRLSKARSRAQGRPAQRQQWAAAAVVAEV